MGKIVAMMALVAATAGVTVWAEMPAATSAPTSAAAVSPEVQKLTDEVTKLGGTVTHDEKTNALTIVNLRDMEATDATLALVKGVATIENLDLANTKVTDAGMDQLKGLSALTHLVLSDTALTDAGLAKLQGLSKLILLDISRTKVTDKAVKEIQKALPKCQIDWIFDNPDEPKEKEMK